MNIIPSIRTMSRSILPTVSRLLTMESPEGVARRQIHQLCISGNTSSLQNLNTNSLKNSSMLLQPTLPLLNPVCGLKVRGKLERRCKGCYYVARKGRLYVMCKENPRHKQTQMMARTYKTWILTHATQGSKRPW